MRIPFAEHVRWSPFCVYVTYVKGQTYINESRRIARQDGSGDIYTVALNELIWNEHSNSFFINPIHGPLSQENNNIQNMYSPVDG